MVLYIKIYLNLVQNGDIMELMIIMMKILMNQVELKDLIFIEIMNC